MVICLSVPQARFAGRTGLAGAIGAESDAVALVISGDVQGGQGDRDLTDRDEDGDLAGRLGAGGSVRGGIPPMQGPNEWSREP